MSFMNRTAPEDHMLPGMTDEYPMMQWFNGIDHTEGPMGQGGFELPLSHFKDMVDIEAVDVPHQYGTVTVPGYLFPVMSLCIVQSHLSYYLKDSAGEVIAWSDKPRFADGYRSKALYLCYALEIEKTKQLTPFVLSMKSTVAKKFKEVLRQFRDQVLAAAEDLSGNQCPHYFFYIPIGSAGRVFHPDAAIPYSIAPPTPYWAKMDDLGAEKQIDVLSDLEIPEYLYEHIVEKGMKEAKEWKKALTNATTNTQAAAPTPPITPEPEPVAYEIERPDTEPPATISPADAEKLFYEIITDAIKTGTLSVAAIADYTQSVNEAGWPAVLAKLELDLAD